MDMKEVFDKSKNFVFVGESGCGKTELALNFAGKLAEDSGNVILLDMDQTKPLFRARNAAEEFENVDIQWQEQLLDTPVVPAAVRESLEDAGKRVIMDVGGNDLGVHMIGQYRDLLNKENSTVFFVINPNRSWSGTTEGITATFETISASSGIEKMAVVGNPNYGWKTSFDDVSEGLEKMKEMLPEIKLEFIGVPEQFAQRAQETWEIPVLPIKRYCQTPWEKM